MLSSFYPQIRQVLTTYAMKGVVDVGGHESQGAGHANEALTMNRDEFWRLVTDMNVLGRYLPKVRRARAAARVALVPLGLRLGPSCPLLCLALSLDSACAGVRARACARA